MTIPRKAQTRVLLIAEACNPAWSSVPLVGYNLYRALAGKVDVTLVTQIRNRDALLSQGSANGPIEFIDSELLAKPMHKLGRVLTLGRGLGWTTRQAIMWLPYLYFEYLLFRRFRKELDRGDFDLIHRITPLTPTFPSPLACWTSIPFVLGPLNGGLPWPKGTARIRLSEMEWLSYLRRFYRLLPYVRRTYRRAACVIAGSRYTQANLPRQARRRSVYLPENGIDPTRFHAEGRLPPSQVTPFRILFVGRLVPLKGVDMLFHAVAASEALQHAAITVIGQGSAEPDLRRLAADLGIAGQIEWGGWVSQDSLVQRFHESSVFVLPSLKEFGGAVVLEAMACGLPCVVMDYGGPAEFVTEETGVRIAVGRRDAMIASLRDSLDKLLAQREKLDVLSQACVHRIREGFTWDQKAARICEVYEQVLEKTRH